MTVFNSLSVQFSFYHQLKWCTICGKGSIKPSVCFNPYLRVWFQHVWHQAKQNIKHLRGVSQFFNNLNWTSHKVLCLFFAKCLWGIMIVVFLYFQKCIRWFVGIRICSYFILKQRGHESLQTFHYGCFLDVLAIWTQTGTRNEELGIKRVCFF